MADCLHHLHLGFGSFSAFHESSLRLHFEEPLNDVGQVEMVFSFSLLTLLFPLLLHSSAADSVKRSGSGYRFYGDFPLKLF
jgi:hypothetical protein